MLTADKSVEFISQTIANTQHPKNAISHPNLPHNRHLNPTQTQVSHNHHKTPSSNAIIKNSTSIPETSNTPIIY